MTVQAERNSATARAPTRARQVEGAAVGFFMTSGAAGLIYQVVWSRELVLVFGNTTQAISTIVTAFMIGLGLGSWAGGRVTSRRWNGLRLYGILELLIALFAVILPLGFHAIGEVYRATYNSLGHTEITLVRLALALAAVTPATFLMGMTLPLLTMFMVRYLGDVGPRLGELYAANTVGAVFGTMAAGVVLIELLGLRGTSYVAVSLNLFAGIGAVALSRRTSGLPDGRAVSVADPAQESEAASGLASRNLILFCTFVSGFVALALEILWTRLIAEGSGLLIYTFVIILGLYLLGIAAGSTIYKRRSSAARDTLTALGTCFAGVGLTAVASVIVCSGVVTREHAGWLAYLSPLPGTILMGYAFPLSGRLITRTAGEAGRSAGVLYAWNTVGCILGSFAGAFILAPTLGTNTSILILAAASALLGAGLVGADATRATRARVGLAVPMVALALLTVGATALRLPFTRTLTENILRRTGVASIHREDNLATVDAVGGPPAKRRLFVSGVGMTHLTIDTKLMAYLPKVLRPQATDFLVIAFGMGTTYRSGLILGMRTDAVELSPSVPSLMSTFYPDAEQFLNHPDGRIIIADGRNYVRLSDKQYDIVAVDPPPPIQSAGTVVLYTREFLEQGKARLKPGGLLMLWIPYAESLSDFKEHVRTFRAVFEHVDLVFGPGRSGVYMLGSEAAMTYDDATVERVFGSEAAKRDWGDAPDAPPTTAAGWVQIIKRNRWLSDGQVDAFAGSGALITDDRPRTEYFLLRSLFSGDQEGISEERLRAASKAHVSHDDLGPDHPLGRRTTAFPRAP